MSVWPQGKTYAPYHIAHSPSACRQRERERERRERERERREREREREINMPGLQLGMMNYIEICRQFT